MEDKKKVDPKKINTKEVYHLFEHVSTGDGSNTDRTQTRIPADVSIPTELVMSLPKPL